MKSHNILLRANRLNERIVRIEDATVIISANMKKAGVVGRALVISDYQEGGSVYSEIQFVYEKNGEYTNLIHRLMSCQFAEPKQQGLRFDLYPIVVDKIEDFCKDFQSVGNSAGCPCDYWLVPGNTEIVDA